MRYKSDHSRGHKLAWIQLSLALPELSTAQPLLALFSPTLTYLILPNLGTAQPQRYQNENNTYIAQLWVMGYKQQHCDLININEISQARVVTQPK